MTDYREQAIKDVAHVMKITIAAVKGCLVDLHNPTPFAIAVRYAVAQRERVLRLQAALEELWKYSPHSGDMALMIRASQSGGMKAQAEADALVEFYSHLDQARDTARAALADEEG